MKYPTALLVLFGLVLLGCQQPSDDKDDNSTPTPATDEVLSQTVPAGDPYTLIHSSTSATARSVGVNLNVPQGSRVFYLVTNTSSNPSVGVNLKGVASQVARSAASEPRRSPARVGASPVRYPGLAERVGSTWRPASNRGAARAAQAAYTAPVVGEPLTFHDHDFHTGALIETPSTLRYRSDEISGRRLNIWVADNCWGAAASIKVTQAMVDALAARFLATGSNNDIYDWVTTMVGREWADGGSAPRTGLIDGHGEVHIFIKNLNPNGTDEGGLMGYFDATNNFLASYDAQTAESNEKILFAIDAGYLVDPDDGDSTTYDTWDITDYWPSEVLSTLAHEFQHMVQFYQKQVIHFDGTWKFTDTWVNEMASLITEDLVADKLLVPGPRGVSQAGGSYDYGTGSAANQVGRLPLFNIVHDQVALTDWDHPESVLYNYSNAYAFGAWAFRNFGGPLFLKNVVQNEYYDSQAVVAAVHGVAQGTGQDYASLVRDWGAATFLGRDTTSGPYHFWAYATSGSVFSWSNVVDFETISRSYNAGSIDLYNYRVWYGTGAGDYIDGPSVYRGFPTQDYGLPAGASFFALASNSSSTKFTDTVNLPGDLALTVVVVP